MKYLPAIFFSIIFLTGCSGEKNRDEGNITQEVWPLRTEVFELTSEQTERLAKLPLQCLQQEYPNKLGQVLGSESDLGKPGKLHPAFYGCFDWHSSVHGHWSLVWLLKNSPGLKTDSLARAILKNNLSAENLQAEVDYFNGEHNSSYERTYGWAWLLKLALELHEWEDPLARELEANMEPLTSLIVSRYLEFLPKLLYPIRVGEHSNTAFGLAFAWDYALVAGKDSLLQLIDSRARDYYLEDSGCPMGWEPSGFDFLSPCLEEIDLMMRVLDREEFLSWLSRFMPELADPDYQLDVARVADRSDGKLVHLDGLNFSRAWVLFNLASNFPEYKHLVLIAEEHLHTSLPNLVGDSYEGGHWLASFAFYAMDRRP